MFFHRYANKILSICYVLFLIQASYFFFSFLYAIYAIDFSKVPTSIFWRIANILIPPILWVISTDYKFLNYHRSKIATYIFVISYETLLLTSIFFELLSRLMLPTILSLKTDEFFTKTMLLFLARLLTELPSLFFAYVIFHFLFRPIRDKNQRTSFLNFKLSHAIPTHKKTSQIQYPLVIAKDIASGRDIVVNERDRFLHTLVDGTSGTGKTSSTILPAIKNDLNERMNAQMLQFKKIKPLFDDGFYTYQGDGGYFSVFDFAPSAKANTEIPTPQEIALSSPACGITVLAPEDSLTDDVCKLCEARNIPYNRIDATKGSDGLPKPNWTGMNPFFVSQELSGDDLQEAIVKKAVVFSDVMQVITDLKGKADSYFSGLNRQMLSNVAILVMNTIPLLHNRQATPADLQLLINNFDLLPPYVAKLEELDKELRRYTFIIQYMKEELLGKGRPKMEDQCRGTRNIINEFLLMPGSREIYCSQTSIDFDRILSHGEITVCNYDLASGDTNAVAFGLFFLLSFNNAVLSRPGNETTRIPHFFYIDELPVLIHSSLEKNFSLFRKFRVAMFCAIQTLDQFEKNDITKYLKGVILGCAHIMVFGRSSLSDMEIFSQLAGIHDESEVQNTVTETSLSSDSPTLSYSSREMFTQKNKIEEVDIRMKDFQEVTYFTTKDGRPIPPYHAKVEFLKPQDWKPDFIPKIDASIFLKADKKNLTTPTRSPSASIPFHSSEQTITAHYQLNFKKNTKKNDDSYSLSDIQESTSCNNNKNEESLDGLF